MLQPQTQTVAVGGSVMDAGHKPHASARSIRRQQLLYGRLLARVEGAVYETFDLLERTGTRRLGRNTIERRFGPLPVFAVDHASGYRIERPGAVCAGTQGRDVRRARQAQDYCKVGSIGDR